MENFFNCLHCGKSSLRNCRVGRNQKFCGSSACQRARKAIWKRKKLVDDQDYKATQQLSNQKWSQNHPDYWRKYRQKNPAQASRNRILQKIRNVRRNSIAKNSEMIAKVDALATAKSLFEHGDNLFWIIPKIAKVDALIVKISIISNC